MVSDRLKLLSKTGCLEVLYEISKGAVNQSDLLRGTSPRGVLGNYDTVVDRVTILVEMGLVKRVESREPQRVITLSITESGRRFLDCIDAVL